MSDNLRNCGACNQDSTQVNLINLNSPMNTPYKMLCENNPAMTHNQNFICVVCAKQLNAGKPITLQADTGYREQNLRF